MNTRLSYREQSAWLNAAIAGDFPGLKALRKMSTADYFAWVRKHTPVIDAATMNAEFEHLLKALK